jgi:hypothetical protein
MKFRLAVPWLRCLVANLTPQRPGFARGSVYEEFEVGKVAWDRFFSEFFGFPCQYHSTEARCSYIIWMMIKRPIGGCSTETQSYTIDMNEYRLNMIQKIPFSSRL